jgi:hypothetical protein
VLRSRTGLLRAADRGERHSHSLTDLLHDSRSYLVAKGDVTP